MQFFSTRDQNRKVTSSEAIAQGLSNEGGLFVPESFPQVDVKALCELDYPAMAAAVIKEYLTDYSQDFLTEAAHKTYGEAFGGKAGYLAPVEGDTYALELWHGPTCAFKDYALQLMPKLLVEAKKNLGRTEKTLILVATSGDTGKAALDGYHDIPGVEIAVFYPTGGTSEIQRAHRRKRGIDGVYPRQIVHYHVYRDVYQQRQADADDACGQADDYGLGVEYAGDVLLRRADSAEDAYLLCALKHAYICDDAYHDGRNDKRYRNEGYENIAYDVYYLRYGAHQQRHNVGVAYLIVARYGVVVVLYGLCDLVLVLEGRGVDVYLAGVIQIDVAELFIHVLEARLGIHRRHRVVVYPEVVGILQRKELEI